MARFGWCLTGHHDRCKAVVQVSTLTGKRYECDCPCHAEIKKALEELI